MTEIPWNKEYLTNEKKTWDCDSLIAGLRGKKNDPIIFPNTGV